MSEAAVYAVASGKGGVGKTTTTINLAAALAESHEVCVVDADLGMGTLAAALDLSIDGPTLHDALAGEASIDDATYEYEPGGFAVVPGRPSLDAYAGADPANLRAALDELRSTFEIVFLDTGAGLSHDTVVPLGAADAVLLLSTSEAPAIANARTTREVADRVGTEVLGAVLARVDPGTAVDPIKEALGVRVLATLPEDEAVPESVAAGEPVVVHAPDSPSAAGYAELADRFASAAIDDATPSDRSSGVEAEGGEDEPTSGAEETAIEEEEESTETETDESEETSSEDTDAEDDPKPRRAAEADDEPDAESESAAPNDASPESDADAGASGGLLSRLLGRG